MGVPKFYRWISERYPCLSEVVKEFQIPEFDNLYLDMNGIVHVCSHPEDDNPHFRITEEKIFADIMYYLEFLFRMIKPRKVFFMAVDGVAPRAKMNQQRGRRFRSAREAEELEKRAKEKGEVLPTEKRFDSNCITPGTPFMVRLQEQLKYFVVKKISTDPLWQGVRVFLSGHETPGEGEHKIMDFIRAERSQPGYNPNTRHCLYGLDADLMMLGLATHEPHFSLLREEVRFGGKKDRQKRPATPEETTFHLLHLSLFREYLDFEFSALKTTLPFKYSLENVIDDWVLMGFLVGNDFIPHLPNLHINHDALPLLWRTYIEVLPSCGGYINEGGHLNLERFEKYMVKLSEFDTDTFAEQAGDLKWFAGKKAEGQSEKEREEMMASARKLRKNIKKMENQFALLDAMSQDIEDFDVLGAELIDSSPDEISEDPSLSEGDDDDTLDDEFRHHKRNYYMTKMEYDKVTPEVLRDQSEGYVRGIQWILLYYYEGVPSWSWFYPHHYAPYMSDVKDFKDMNITFGLGRPFKPFEQLMAVLPAASKELLPPAFQKLMIMDSSPVLDFYPLEFQTDLNGKQQDWEAVVLIPFIDEERLLSAMRTAESGLTEEERSRNIHGPCLLYEYQPEPGEPYPSNLPQAFPDIAVTHSRLTKVPLDEFRIDSESLVKGLLPGTKLDVFFPGFPTLKHIPHKAELSKEGVRVFQMNSRGFNTVIYIEEGEDPDPDINRVAKEYIGKEIFVGWPHLYEARVTAVCNDKTIISLVDPPPGKGSKSTSSTKVQSKMEACDENTANIWHKEVSSIAMRYQERLGIVIGDTSILLKALPMTGRKYIFGSHGRITMEKQFGTRPIPFALQATVKDIAVHDSSFCQFQTLQEYLPMGTPVFMLGWPHYGNQGEVIETDPQTGRVRINLTTFEEPNLTKIRNNQQLHEERYMPGYIMAQRLGVSGSLLSRITGTIFMVAGDAELASQQKNPHRVNIGLNLKFTKRGEEVPGYTKMNNGQWSYSDKTLQAIQQYMQKYPEMFQNISKMADQRMNDVYYESETIPEHCNYTLKDVQEYLKSLPCAGLKSMKSGADIISEGTIQALEQEATRIVEINKKRQKRIKMQVKPHLLFRPMPTSGALIPDSTTQYLLFDRVVNVRQGFPVPFGLRGTVVGIHPADVEVNTVYEVVFDEDFQGGITIRNSSTRGYRMPPSSLLNLTHGERKNGVKGYTPPQASQAQSGQTYGQPQSRSYAEASYGGNNRGNQYMDSNRAWTQQNQTGSRSDNMNWRAGAANPRDRTGSSQERQPQHGRNFDGDWRQKDGYSRMVEQQSAGKVQNSPSQGGQENVFNGAGGPQPTFVTPRVSQNVPTARRQSQGETGNKYQTDNPPPPASNNEFEEMWKQLQSSQTGESTQGTSLSQAAAVLPVVPPPSGPQDSKPEANTKIDVMSLFSQTNRKVSVNDEAVISDEVTAEAVEKTEEKGEKKASTRVVSNDEFAAMFKSLQVADEKEEGEEDEETKDVSKDPEDSSIVIKKMLHIDNQAEEGEKAEPPGGGSSGVTYGRQVSIQELFAGAKQQQGHVPSQQQQQQHQPKLAQAGQKQPTVLQSQGHPWQQGYPPKAEQQPMYQNQKQPQMMVSPPQAGNRYLRPPQRLLIQLNPVMELMTHCQSLQMGLPIYNYVQKSGKWFCVVSLHNGTRFQGSNCQTREEATESAASVALLQLRGSLQSMGGQAMMRMPGYVPGVIPQGRQFSSPNSAFSPVNMYNAGQFPAQRGRGHHQGFTQQQQQQQRPYPGMPGYQQHGNRGNHRQQNYPPPNQYQQNQYQQNPYPQQQQQHQQNQYQQNQYHYQQQQQQQQAYNRNQSATSTQQTPAASLKEDSSHKQSKVGISGTVEVKTQPTCVVTPFVPLQVVKKQTPTKPRKESVSEDASTVRENNQSKGSNSSATVTPAKGSNSKDLASKTSERVNSEGLSSPPQGHQNSVTKTKTQENRKNDRKTPEKTVKGNAPPGSGKKSKRRLAANFNFDPPK